MRNDRHYFDLGPTAKPVSASRSLAEPSRQNRFSGLAPNLASALVLGLTQLQFLKMKVVLFEGLRSKERHAWLYAQGRTRPGQIVTNAPTYLHSWHGYGLSADLVFLDESNRPYWPTAIAQWRKIDDVLDPFGLTLGIDWTFKDMPHCQPKNLKTSPSPLARQLVATGGIEAVWRETGHHKAFILDLDSKLRYGTN